MPVNYQQIVGMLRIFIPAFLGWFVPKYIPAEMVGPLTEQILQWLPLTATLVFMLWSWFAHGKVIQIDNASKMEGVHQIIADDAIANGRLLKNNTKVVAKRE